ncbi:ribulose-bisphosphate carboxylase large subunit family protein [Rubellimicrobium roseum]|uniref:Ribulose 1,5-bisphosphate carboxylase n=1 Tax=Rubellimicrobium roseum TaxID=687525 RepID=A0A5C4N6U3_9RHOB|nr:ribulose-bisphosphate carboxylase large subunit family protein [Rubellimicrobium roseum]TNC65035.1 ribulose 1,5-bisphosphate carboxylase [Rubellimicrobium roseum]
MTDRIEADYLIETAEDPSKAAQVMAGEQSSGTFVSVPGEDAPGVRVARARVERLEVVGEAERPSLPGATPGRPVLARATLSWPLSNMGPSLPNLQATVAGNLFELRAFSGLKLLDLRLPRAFADRNPGPRWGIKGTRRLTGVAAGPLIGTIIKPSVGLSPEETADLVRTLVEAGIDFIKDDELQADGPHCPFPDRVRAVMRVIRDHADRTGKKVMFAFNLTGEVDEMRARHDLVLAEGGTAVMASMHSVGLTGMLALARHTQLPIHAHRNGWGSVGRHPNHGISYVAWSKLWRLAGADHLHVNGLANKFCEDDESVIASARSLLTPLWEDAPMVTMPVFSSGQTIRQAAGTWAALGTDDLIHAAGGGILAHPQGPKAGVESLREAWAAAKAGEDIANHAAHSPALAGALEAYR